MKSPRGPDSNETGGHDSQSCLSEKKGVKHPSL